jgi:hypothetical protein
MHPLRHCVIAALLVTPLIAQGGWINKSGVALPDSPDRKAIGDFGAQLILVGDENALIEIWNTPSNTVNVSTTDRASVGSFVSAFIVFSGCSKDKPGNCNVSVRFRVVDPTGGTYADTPPMEVWKAKPAPRGRSLGLSADFLKIRIEPQDKLGLYLVKAQVLDNNSGKRLDLQQSFTAFKAAK